MAPLLLSPQRRPTLGRQLLAWQLGTVLLLLLSLGAGTLWNTERRTLELLRSARQDQAAALLQGRDLSEAVTNLSDDALNDWLDSWRDAAGAAMIAVWPEGERTLAFDGDSLEAAEALLTEDGKLRLGLGSGVLSAGEGRLYWQADDLMEGQRPAGRAVVAFTLPSRAELWAATVRGLGPWLALALVLSLLGTALLARQLRRVTRGLEPADLAALSEGQERLLQTVRDGVIEVQGGQVTLANAAAAEALGLGRLPQAVGEVWPALAALDLGTEARQLPLPLRGRVMRLNVTPLSQGGLVAFTEWQEVARLAEELTQTRSLMDAMRARAHEYGNRLHVVAGFLQLGRPAEALGVIQEELEAEQGLGAALAQFHEPRIAALLAGKMARARELRLKLTLDEGSELPADLPPDVAEALLAALGNYLENALDAPQGLTLEVRDNGAGLADGLTPFTRGQSTKGAGRGTGLAAVAALCRAAGGEVWTARQGDWTVFGVNFDCENADY